MSNCEDISFAFDCFLKAGACDVICGPYYEYRQDRVGSLTYTTTPKVYRDQCCFVIESIEKLRSEDDKNVFTTPDALSFVAYEYSLIVWKYSCVSQDLRTEALAFLRKYHWVLKYGKTIRLRAIYLLCGVVGFHLTSKLLDCYMTMRKKRKLA